MLIFVERLLYRVIFCSSHGGFSRRGEDGRGERRGWMFRDRRFWGCDRYVMLIFFWGEFLLGNWRGFRAMGKVGRVAVWNGRCGGERGRVVAFSEVVEKITTGVFRRMGVAKSIFFIAVTESAG